MQRLEIHVNISGFDSPEVRYRQINLFPCRMQKNLNIPNIQILYISGLCVVLNIQILCNKKECTDRRQLTITKKKVRFKQLVLCCEDPFIILCKNP